MLVVVLNDAVISLSFHRFQLKANPGFWHRNVVLEIPIVIGNIPPLKSFANFQQPAADAYSDPMSLLVAKADDDYDSPVYRIRKRIFASRWYPK
jgi:hypothetical protein